MIVELGRGWGNSTCVFVESARTTGARVVSIGNDGENAWRRLPAAAKQQLRDNIFTLLGQVHEARKPYSKADMPTIRTPTLLVGGAVL